MRQRVYDLSRASLCLQVYSRISTFIGYYANRQAYLLIVFLESYVGLLSRLSAFVSYVSVKAYLLTLFLTEILTSSPAYPYHSGDSSTHRKITTSIIAASLYHPPFHLRLIAVLVCLYHSSSLSLYCLFTAFLPYPCYFLHLPLLFSHSFNSTSSLRCYPCIHPSFHHTYTSPSLYLSPCIQPHTSLLVSSLVSLFLSLLASFSLTSGISHDSYCANTTLHQSGRSL